MTLKTLYAVFVLCWLLSYHAFAENYSTRNMIIRLNGHDYNTHDFVSEEINKSYQLEKESMRQRIDDKTYSNDGVTGVDVYMPDDIAQINFTAGTAGKGRLFILIDDIADNFAYMECRIDTKFDIQITADVELVPDKLSYKLKISNTVAKMHDWRIVDCTGIRCLFAAPAVAAFVFFADLVSDPFEESIANREYGPFDLRRLPDNELTTAQISEAINSFPMDVAISGGPNQNLVLSLNYLRGTLASPTAFDNITPTAVSDPTFEHIGFNLSRGSLYNVFSTYAEANRPFTSTGETGNLAQRNFIIQSMKNHLGRSVSLYFHWGDIAADQNGSTLLVNGSYDPATLTPGPGGVLEQKIAELYANGTWTKQSEVLESLHSNEFDVVATVGTGGYIKNDAGITAEMAPDRSMRGINGSHFYVDKNTYLYYLKIYAHAVVRRYKDQIGVWLIQPELNAAKFASWIGFGGKRGNCWDEEGNTNDKFQWQLWRTWVDAVRTEDPSAKVSTALHMLNMQYGLETFGPDCDIISINLYPNEMFAMPVMGFAVGEMVWAVRRALQGMGWQHKPVWVTETNYPGKINSSAEEPPAGTTPEENITWYSYGRQGKYMQDAIETAAANGAKGFFWWGFLDSEAGYPPLPYTGYGSLIIGNSNPPQFKEPAVTAFQAKSSAKHFGKSNVTLTNKSVSNQSGNLGGLLSVYSERDNLPSGSSVYMNKNRSHISRTHSQTISFYKHQSWGNSIATPVASEYRLIESFTPSLPSVPRNAWFNTTYPVSFSAVSVENGAIPNATLNYLDPWYVDGNGNQNNIERTIMLTPTFGDNIFPEQTIDPQNPNQPYYKLTAPATQTITVNGQQSTVNFLRWTGTNSLLQSAEEHTTGIVFQQGATITAHYKAQLATSTSTGYNASNQRKVLRTPDGVIHVVYESGGKLWYEVGIESGGGFEWQYGNGAKPIGSSNAKSPSLSSNGNVLVVVYQEQSGTNDFKIVVEFFENQVSIAKQEITTAIASYSHNAEPVVAYSPDDRMVVVWKQSSGTPGLYYLCTTVEPQGYPLYSLVTPSSSGLFSGTDANSAFPTIDANRSVHLAWWNFQVGYAHNGTIQHRIIHYKNNVWTIGNMVNISSGSGFTTNTKPSVIAIGTEGARISWLGTRWEAGGGLEKRQAEEEDGAWVTKAVFKDPSVSGTFWSYEDQVSSVNIQKNIAADGSEPGYIIGWSAAEGAENRYTRSSSLVQTNAFNVQGNDVQIIGGTSWSTMYGTFLNPVGGLFKIERSSSVQSLGKQQTEKMYSGRSGIAAFGDAEFYFAVGDVSASGQEISFKEKHDTLDVDGIGVLNEYLTTEPFQLTDQSEFLYSVQYGFNDSAAAVGALSEGGYIDFRLELVDDATNAVIGEYDAVRYTETNVFQHAQYGYIVNSSGIGSRTVRLRLVVASSMEANFALNNIIGSKPLIALGKGGILKKRIGYKGSLAVTEYSLGQNFPNPFNPSTTISYALPQDGLTTLKVYDALGREVAELVNEFKTTGRYTASFDALRLSSGVYVYRLVSDKYSAVKKMLMLK